MQFDQSIEIPDDEAKTIICEIVANGILILSNHTKERMAERGYSLQDVVHILLRNGDEITSPTMHHSFRSNLSDLKSQKP